MTIWTIVLALALGALGAAANVAVTRWRAGLVRNHGAAAVVLTFPLGLLGPVAAVLLAVQLAPEAAWLAVLGLVLTRWLALRRGRACCGGDT